MSKKKIHHNRVIGVGPFLVPGIASFGFEANILNVVLENPTKKKLKVKVKVKQSPNNDDPGVYAPVYPDTDSHKITFRQSVTLPPKNWTIIAVPILPYKIYQVILSGNVGVASDENDEKIMVSILGGVKAGDGNDCVLFPEPALSFGYEKFVALESDD